MVVLRFTVAGLRLGTVHLHEVYRCSMRKGETCMEQKFTAEIGYVLLSPYIEKSYKGNADGGAIDG
jgi:hypothetical protein